MTEYNKRKYLLPLFVFILSVALFFFYFFYYRSASSSIPHEIFFSTLKGSDAETERLKLSPTTKEHVEILSDYLKDKEVCTMLIPELYETEGFVDKNAVRKYIAYEITWGTDKNMFTILLKSKDGKLEPIGQIAFDFKYKGVLWLSYWIGKKFHRQGYMSELIPLIKKYFDRCSDIEQMHVQCFSNNIGSGKICRKICDLFTDKKDEYRVSKGFFKEKNTNKRVFVWKFDIYKLKK